MNTDPQTLLRRSIGPDHAVMTAWDFGSGLRLLATRGKVAATRFRAHLARNAPQAAAALPQGEAALARWLTSLLQRAAERCAVHDRPFDVLEHLWETQRHDAMAQHEGRVLVSALVATLAELMGERFDRDTRMGWTCACNLLVAESLQWATHARGDAPVSDPRHSH